MTDKFDLNSALSERINSALKACEGLSNAELIQRGPGGFSKMIDRKRKYAAAARLVATANEVLAKELAKTKKALEQAQAQIATLEQLDTPIGDTTQAASMLASIAAKPAAPGAQA